MSDETPAGDPRPPEYPAPEWTPPPARDPDATRRGIRAAVMIFAAAVVLHVLLLVGIKLSGDRSNAWLFLPEGLMVMLVGFIAAIVVTVRLPQDSRGPFWLAGIACMFGSATVWAATCAMSM